MYEKKRELFVRTRTALRDKAYQELAIAIVKKACYDYLYKPAWKIDCIHFFKSQWFAELMPDVNPDYVMRVLDEMKKNNERFEFE